MPERASQLYYAAILVDAPPEGFRAADWPPRIPVLSRFELDIKTAIMIGEHVGALLVPMEVELGGIREYGQVGSRYGRDVMPRRELETLHFALHHNVDIAGGHFASKSRNITGFEPHVPGRNRATRALPSKLTVDKFSLVERRPKNCRRVVQTFELTGAARG